MRYVALVWDANSSETSILVDSLVANFLGRERSWHIVVLSPGLCVCAIGTGGKFFREYLLHSDGGCILGKIFEKQTGGAYEPTTPISEVVIDEKRSDGILKSTGRELIDRYWGEYVAFLRNSASRTVFVIRDPSGRVPCQWTKCRGVDMYFSNLEDCQRVSAITLTLNRRYLVGLLLFSNHCVRETPFQEVETVFPGERIEHRASEREHAFVWNPIKIAQNPIEDEEEAVRLTFNTVRSCVDSLSSCFGNILLALSGGLDSSILAATLSNSPAHSRVLCRHYYSSGPNADERDFARAVAAHTRLPLIEEEAGLDIPPESITAAVRSLFPVTWPVDMEDIRRDVRFLRTHDIDVFINGNGGDEVLFRVGSFPTCVDYGWQHGIDQRLIRVALDDAILNRASLWKMLHRAYKQGLGRKYQWHPRHSFSLDQWPLVPADVVREAATDAARWHPLFEAGAALPPGKLEHVHTLCYGTTQAYNPFSADYGVPILSPLRSQPLLELSLQVPLYVLRTGGRDRSIARRAFAGVLPPKIIHRKSKAHGTARYEVFLSEHIQAIRDLLLTGYLVRERLVSRDLLEDALSGRPSDIRTETLDICKFLSIELWAKAWADKVPNRQEILLSVA